MTIYWNLVPTIMVAVVLAPIAAFLLYAGICLGAGLSESFVRWVIRYAKGFWLCIHGK